MADGGPRRVVARDREQDEERGDLVAGQRVLIVLGVHERGDEIVGRLGAPQIGELVDERGELESRSEHGGHRIPAPEHIGVAGSEDDVGRVEHGVEFAAGDAHHVADDEERERLRERFDEIDLAAFAHLVDDLGADRLDRVEHALELFGGEGASDDSPLARVPRVVHADERPEELHRVGGHVGDRHGTPARAEVLRPTADLDHLRVPGRDEERLLEAVHRVLERRGQERGDLAELGEARHASIERQAPERRIHQLRVHVGHVVPLESRVRPFRSRSIFAHRRRRRRVLSSRQGRFATVEHVLRGAHGCSVSTAKQPSVVPHHVRPDGCVLPRGRDGVGRRRPGAGRADGAGCGRRHEGRARLPELRYRREARVPVPAACAVHASAEEGREQRRRDDDGRRQGLHQGRAVHEHARTAGVSVEHRWPVAAEGSRHRPERLHRGRVPRLERGVRAQLQHLGPEDRVRGRHAHRSRRGRAARRCARRSPRRSRSR